MVSSLKMVDYYNYVYPNINMDEFDGYVDGSNDGVIDGRYEKGINGGNYDYDNGINGN